LILVLSDYGKKFGFYSGILVDFEDTDNQVVEEGHPLKQGLKH